MLAINFTRPKWNYQYLTTYSSGQQNPCPIKWTDTTYYLLLNSNLSKISLRKGTKLLAWKLTSARVIPHRRTHSHLASTAPSLLSSLIMLYHAFSLQNCEVGTVMITLCMQCNPYTGQERPLGLQEVEAPRISIQSALEGGKFISPMYWLPLVPGDTLGTHFFWGLSQPQGHSVAGSHWKIPMIPSGIEPAILWLVVQCLNQPHQCVPHWLVCRTPNIPKSNSMST